MIEREHTSGSKAAFLLAIGAVFGLFGLVLFAGGTFARGVVQEETPQAVLGFLTWGPWTLIGCGGFLATLAAIFLSVDWCRARNETNHFE